MITQKITKVLKQIKSGTLITYTRILSTNHQTFVKLELLTVILCSVCSCPTSWSTSQLGKESRVPERWFGLLALCHMLFSPSFWLRVLLLREVEKALSIFLFQNGRRSQISVSGRELLFKFCTHLVLPLDQLSTMVELDKEKKRS